MRCSRQSPCQGAATPAIGATDPASGSPLRVGCWQPPPCGCAVGNLLQAGRWRSSIAGSSLAVAPTGWPQSAALCGLLPLQATAPCRWPTAPL
ncbi:hypothetical protein B296_00033688 [Ensete ventricosum]|uniref:Uncharacterized protein n=1 Tax=Ensete ventricosum TaxID=4639 RepID=A0A426Y8Y7_ENSVE|nr:hypothetical protein B296_00033688 [Ensete ventricosum]